MSCWPNGPLAPSEMAGLFHAPPATIRGMDERRDLIEIDLSAVSTPSELQTVLSQTLGFPDFYGRNWNAFWDAITGLVLMPQRLRLLGWSQFSARLPNESRQLRECLDDALAQYPQI